MSAMTTIEGITFNDKQWFLEAAFPGLRRCKRDVFKIDQEIFKGILDQTIKEGELARSASRLMHLDQAIGKIDENLGRARGKYLKAVKRVSGRKQNTMLAGYRAKSGVRRVYA